MNVNVAVSGLGWIGQFEATLYKDMENATLVAGADPDPEAREEFESVTGVPTTDSHERLLRKYGDRIDAVTIATPHALHFEQAKAALERDISVLVEKPMVTELSHAQQLVDLASRTDATLSVGYQRRFHDGFSEVKRVVESGQLGDIHTISCHVGQSWIELNEDSWRVDADLADGGQLYDTGSHMLESLFWTCDLTPTAVTGLMESRGEDVDLNSALSARFDRRGSDVLGSIAVCADSTDIYPDEGLVVWGTEGRLVYDKDGRLPDPKERLRVVGPEGPAYTAEFDRGVDYETLTERKVEAFVETVVGTRENPIPGRFGLTLSKFRAAARRAWTDGEVVNVEEYVARRSR